MKIKNWSESVSFEPARFSVPNSEAELIELVRQATPAQPIRVMGTGHSFGPLIETSSTLLSLARMTGLQSVDPLSGDALVWGGTPLWKLNELLFSAGRSLENLGDINKQSIAGTVSTGTHGTGLRLGSVSTQLREVKLILANGSRLITSETENPEYFKAAQVSLGALGVISQVKLKTLPAYRLRLEQKKEKLVDCLNQIQAHRETNRHFEFFSFPYSPYAQTKYANQTDLPAQTKGIGDFLNDFFMENLLFKLLSEISEWVPGLTRPIAKLCGAALSPRTKVSWAHEVFSMPRLVKFQEMEFSVPAERLADTVQELNAMIEQKKIRVHFPIECRFVKGDDIWLSPAYGRDSGYIAIHMYQGMEYQSYFEAAQSIFLNQGGRPHWGKMHFLSAKELAPLYPKWDDFQKVRIKLDPEGIFMNAFLRKIFAT